MKRKQELKNEIKKLEKHNNSLKVKNDLFLEMLDVYQPTADKKRSYWNALTEAFTPILLITVLFLMWVPIIYYMFILLSN